MRTRLAIVLGSAFLGTLLVAATGGPALWVQSGAEQLGAGELEGVALSGDGTLRLAPELELLHDTGAPRIWAVERAPDGTLYAAVGDEGKVFRVAPGESDPEVFFSVEQLSAQALVWGPDDHLYVATGPRGAIFRVPPDFNGAQTSPWFVPETTYVWAMEFGPDGALYVGTGRDGRVLRVDSQGNGEVLWDPDEAHVTALAVDDEGRVVVGTEGGGYVARIGTDGDVFVLWDAPLKEITDLVVTPAGIWAAAFGSGDPDEDSGESRPPSFGGPQDSSGGAIYRLHEDGLVETVWSSQETGVHSLVAAGHGVLAGTGPRGELLRIEPGQGAARLGRVEAREVVAMTAEADGWTLATSNLGRVYRLGRSHRNRGEYQSGVKDTGTTSRWGTIRWRGASPAGTSLELYSRSGNTESPDDTWSEWAGPYAVADGTALESPPARFIQWRAVLQTDDPASTPTLERVELVYVPRNLPPRIDSLRVHPIGVVYRQSTSFEDSLPFAQLPASVEAALREMNDESGTTSAASSFLGQPFYVAGLRTFTWEATDPNGDVLRHALEYRGEDEGTWKSLATGLQERMYVFDTARVPDGSYRLRLTTSDGPSNPIDAASRARRTTEAFVVDNTPPEIQGLQAEVVSDRVQVAGSVADATSLVLKIEYSVDAGDWRTVVPADGLADSGQERIEIEHAGLGPGEHTIVVRVTDTALNRGAGKVVVAIR